MKYYINLAILVLLANPLFSQDFSDLNFGTDTTIEIATWNIERFPKNGQISINYVSEIIEQLAIDVFAIQELKDTNDFKQMLSELEHYDGFFKSSYFAGLAYIYNNKTVNVDTIYEIYTTQPYWNPFPRSPVVMECNIAGESFVIINNHLKCCGDGTIDESNSKDEENRRLIASNYLKVYIDEFFNGRKVVLLGDLNDDITEPESKNVFQAFINDVDNYQFADMDIATGSNKDWSYPSWPSHLDHILISGELINRFDRGKGSVKTIKLDEFFDGGFSAYDENITDHRPVVIKLPYIKTTSIKQNELIKMECYPNPASNNICFNLTNLNEDAIIDIFNLSGSKIETIIYPKENQLVEWNVTSLKNGLYIAFVKTKSRGNLSIKITVN